VRGPVKSPPLVFEAMEGTEIDIELNPSQYEALESDAVETFYIGGLGSGKTFTLGCALATYASIPGSIGFLGGPSKDTMKEATFPQVQEALSVLGLEEGIHYVVNTRPPLSWGVKPFSKLSSNRIMTWVWGSYTIIDGLDNFNKRRGTQYDYILVDEFRDVKPKARIVLLGRRRGVTFAKLGIKQPIVYATTPPENPLYLRKLSKLNDPEIKFIITSSYENQDNLPEGYIATLERAYDTETADREIRASLETVISNQFAYKYSEKKHTRSGLEMDPDLDINLSFDFNVNPMTCLAIQYDELQDSIKVLKEFRIENSDTYEMCEAIDAEFGHLDPYYRVTGDASGGNRQSATRGAMTHYQIIADELDLSEDQFDTPASNPSITNSRILLNSILQHFHEFLIDSDECPYLMEDLEFVETETQRNGKVGIKKEGKNEAGMQNSTLTHLLDCLRYYLHTYHFDFINTRRS